VVVDMPVVRAGGAARQDSRISSADSIEYTTRHGIDQRRTHTRTCSARVWWCIGVCVCVCVCVA